MQTTIQWTATEGPGGVLYPGYTFNPWRGCVRVSEGCRFCYAEFGSRRSPRILGEWGKNAPRVLASEEYWRRPLKWDATARSLGVRLKVFCASYADVFEDRDDLVPHRQRLLALVALTPHLDWLLLTKRPENIAPSFKLNGIEEAAGEWRKRHKNLSNEPIPDPMVTPWPNLWLGTSVENQRRADERIPLLLRVPAAVRFLSCEPLLEATQISDICSEGAVLKPLVGLRWVPTARGMELDPPVIGPRIDWVIVGGESGANARPVQLDWMRSLVAQTQEAGAAAFVKQLGAVWAKEWTVGGKSVSAQGDKAAGDPGFWPADLRVRQWPKAAA